ncbi:hypothetical protein [Burkholderia cepacia]|uniref:hypothetical protein n=1 Tax=Burkholderia cepacia TaxID=292 RepID=UPI0015A6F451|nr:hypothetical protein [Burkholderia cepacia]
MSSFSSVSVARRDLGPNLSHLRLACLLKLCVPNCHCERMDRHEQIMLVVRPVCSLDTKQFQHFVKFLHALLSFPCSKPDRIDRHVDPMVHLDCISKNMPFISAGHLVRAMQALVRTGQLLSYGPMYVDTEALAEASDTRAIVPRHPHGIPNFRNIDAVKLFHRFL